MSKRDYFNVAYALRRSNPRHKWTDMSTDTYFTAMSQWEEITRSMADTLHMQYANFNRGMFLAAAGYSIRPDGSQWDVDWATNRIPNFRSV